MKRIGIFRVADEQGTPAEYITQTRRAIAAWKVAPPSVHKVVVSVVFAPVDWLVRKVVPTSAVLGALAGFDWVAKNVLTSAGSAHFEDLRECDRRADQVQTFHIGLAAASGGIAGFFGLAMIPADVSALLTLAMRMIRQVGVEYGYADANEGERQFCFLVIQDASANNMYEKLAAQHRLAAVGTTVAKQTWKAMAEKTGAGALSNEATITTLRTLAKQVGVNLTKRKALGAIPILGLMVGAASNAWFLREIGITAQMSYRQRWLADHIGEEPPEMALLALG